MTIAPATERPIRTWDVVSTIALYLVAVVLGVFATLYTMHFGLALDSCFGEVSCREDLVGDAMLVSLGGIALALFGTPIMLIVAVVKRRPLWIWGVAANLLIIASLYGGLAIVNYAAPM